MLSVTMILLCRSIYAFDKDPKRFAVLKERLCKAGATCVSPILSDILQVTNLQRMGMV